MYIHINSKRERVEKKNKRKQTMTSAQIDTIQALEADNNRLKGEIKMKEELIPGMEKMIAYLQKVQEENKRLKEENKELNENLSHTEDNSWDYYGELLELREENKKLKEENKELKEENEKLFHKADNWELKYHTLRNQLNLSSESDEE